MLVLFDGARADLQVGRDFFVSASIHEHSQHLPITGRYPGVAYFVHTFNSLTSSHTSKLIAIYIPPKTSI
jgi:hypothetical protein